MGQHRYFIFSIVYLLKIPRSRVDEDRNNEVDDTLSLLFRQLLDFELTYLIKYVPTELQVSGKRSSQPVCNRKKPRMHAAVVLRHYIFSHVQSHKKVWLGKLVAVARPKTETHSNLCKYESSGRDRKVKIMNNIYEDGAQVEKM